MKTSKFILIIIGVVLLTATITVGIIISATATYHDAYGKGFSNGVIAAVKCQQDPACGILGPRDIKSGELKEMGTITFKYEE